MFNPYKKSRPPEELARLALEAWIDLPGCKERVQEACVTDAIRAAQNFAYDEAAELVVRYGSISADLARQHIQDCKWGNPFPFDTKESE